MQTRLLLKTSFLLCVLLGTDIVQGQCDSTSNLVYNGDFVSMEGDVVTAPGWSSTVTPDVNDEVGPLNTSTGYVWTGTPLASPTGGTWQNLFDDVETIEQMVGVTQGQFYALCFDYSAQGIEYPGFVNYSDPVGVTVQINGNTVLTTDLDTSLFTWESACHGFFAPSSSITIRFAPTNEAYLAIDGVCLQEENPSSVNALLVNPITPTITPNPIDENAQIEFSNPSRESFEFSLFDSVGKEVRRQRNITGSTMSFDRGSCEPGLYFFKLQSVDSPMIFEGKLLLK